MNLKKSRYALLSGALDAEETLTSKRILFSTRKGMGITISNYVWSLIQEGNFTAIPDNLFNVLMYHELIVPEDEDELEEIITRNQLMALDTSGAELTVYLGSTAALDEQLRQTLTDLLSQHAAASKKKLVLIVAGPSVAAGLQRIHWLSAFLDHAPLVAKLQKEFQLVSLGAGNAAAEPVFAGVLKARVTKVSLVLPVEQAHVPLVFQELRALQGPMAGQPTAPVNIHLLTTSATTKVVEIVNEFQQLKHALGADLYVQLLPPAEVAGAEEAAQQELAWLNAVGTRNVCLNLLPAPTNTYFHTGQLYRDRAETPAAALTLDHPPLELDTAETLAARKFYDASISDLLRANQISCSSCIYLPMCGGRPDKSSTHDHDCPAFVQNFMKKVELKYNLVRS
ncbi:hypothetical protein [Hymenobacter cellulosivorans]|uniref:Radical SAM protein n=1 Tax=Hymenobacter cellulosivorans TaxID=2932249 RepID=A0ABY4FH18_9BACT|nr:hypothetical protein [Hymenobacter cellulosivorans]UOQ53756.1 hypothetical protein MUN80_03110 [Hymenobacter cellulosivorans]